jgi:hypothetical protein
LEKREATGIRELEKKMTGRLAHRRGAAESRIGRNKISRRIDGAAHFTGVTVLILGVTIRALTLDVAIGKKHAFDRVVELFDTAACDQTLGFECTINGVRERHVFGGIGAMPMIEVNVKAMQVLWPFGGITGYQRLRGDARLFRLEHDRRTMCVVGAHKMYRVSSHAH